MTVMRARTGMLVGVATATAMLAFPVVANALAFRGDTKRGVTAGANLDGTDRGAPGAQSAADPWDGAGGVPADPWGQHGTARFALGYPIVGDYAYYGSDGGRHGVVRVRRQRDSSFRGVAVEKWDAVTNIKGSPQQRSETCDIPAGETTWWDINPRADLLDTWTFDDRHYFGSTNVLTGRTFSGDADGASRVECSWQPTPMTVDLMVQQGLLAWPWPSSENWRKLDHGGPVVTAHPASGVPGGAFAVSFTADEPDGWASFYVQIYQRGDLLGGAVYEVEVPIGMPTTYTARGTLDPSENSNLSWCVTVYDAARNKRSDCANLTTGTSQVATGKRGIPYAPHRQRRLKANRRGRTRVRVACHATRSLAAAGAVWTTATSATCGGRTRDEIRIYSRKRITYYVTRRVRRGGSTVARRVKRRGKLLMSRARMPRITARRNRTGTFKLNRAARSALRRRRSLPVNIRIYQDESLRSRTRYTYRTTLRRSKR